MKPLKPGTTEGHYGVKVLTLFSFNLIQACAATVDFPFPTLNGIDVDTSFFFRERYSS